MPVVRHAARSAQGLLLLALPHGGQQVARRNAWAGMVADTQRSRARREAEAAVLLAALRPARTAAR